MRYLIHKAEPVKILIFVMIGAMAIVFTDLCILSDKACYAWWEEDTVQSDDVLVDIERLRVQNAQYLTNGIEIPDTVTASNALPDQINIADYQFAQTTAPSPEPEINIANIEPAVGTEIIDDNINIDNVLSPYKTTNIDNKALDLDNTDEVSEIEILETAEDPITEKTTYQYKPPRGQGKIAIIIDDMGVSLRSKLVEIMPGPLTLAYLPYAKDLPARTKRAKENGHELMVHIPMQPMNKAIDPGPHALKTNQSKAMLTENLNWNLSRFDGFVGVNNHMGSRITQDKAAMNHIMRHLKKRDLFFIDSRTISTSVAAQIARDNGLAYGERDIFLDHEITAEFIQGALKKLEKKAYDQGYAIAIGHPHKETIAALKKWIPTLQDKGLTLVPASAVIRKPVAQDPNLLVSAPSNQR